jgi:hypothetical protein
MPGSAERQDPPSARRMEAETVAAEPQEDLLNQEAPVSPFGILSPDSVRPIGCATDLIRTHPTSAVLCDAW